MQIQPYLFFEGRCEEAIAFYQKAIGAQVMMLMRYKESPVPADPANCPGAQGAGPGPDNVMHATLVVDGGGVLHLSDGSCTGRPNFDGFHLSLNVDTPADADRLFGALCDGGTVTMPIGPTFWSPRFGMARDKFGVGWMVQVYNADAAVAETAGAGRA